MSRSTRRPRSLRSRRLFVLGACLGLGTAARLPAADLTVQGPNSPYPFASGTANYDNIYVGNTASGTLNQTGGALSATTGQLFLGGNAGITGVYNLSGGALNTISTDVGDSGTGVFTLSGTGVHNVTGTDGTANGSLDLAFYSGSTGTYNLNGGTLTAGYVRGGQGNSTFNLNGGTLVAGAAATDFFQNLTHAYVGTGGALVNTNNFNVTVAQNLEHTPVTSNADGGLTKLGAGTLTLTGNNLYTGGTTFNAGTLNVGSAGALGKTGTLSFAGSTLALDSFEGPSGTVNGILQYGAANSTDYSARFSQAANQAVNVDTNGRNVTFATGLTSSGGSLTKLGAGTLTLTGASTYTGNTIVSAGTLALTGSVISGGGANLLVDGSAAAPPTLTLGTGSALGTGAAIVGFFGTGAVNQTGGSLSTNGDVLLLGVAGGNSVGNGSYTLSGGSVLAGTVIVGFGGTGAFTQSAGSVTVAGTLYLGGGQYSYNGGTVSTFSPASNGSYTLGGANSTLAAASVVIGQNGPGTFIQNGGTVTAGTLTLSGASSSPGVYTLAGGTLNVGTVANGSSSASAGTSVLHLAGGILQAGANNATLLGGLGTADVEGNGGALVDTQANTVTVTQNLVHDTSANAPATDGGLTKLGAGTLILTGTNAYTGATTIGAGVLQVGNGGTAGTLGTSTAALTDNGTLAFDRSDNLTLANVIGGTGALTQQGSGTLTLTGNNTYTGGTTLAAGTLALGSAGALGTSGTLSFSGGILQYGAANSTDYSARFSQAANQAVNVDTNGRNVTFATGLASPGGTLTKLGAGTLTLTGASTYTGNTAVSAGTLAVDTGGSLGATTVNVGAGAAFNLTGAGVLTGATSNLILNGTAVAPATATLGSTGASYRGTVTVGNTGVGTLTQTAGALNVNGSGSFTLGFGAGSVGTFNLGGAGSSFSAPFTYVGRAGAGTVNQTGGSFSTNGSAVYVGLSGTGTGTVNQAGGAFSTNGAALVLGYLGSGSYVLSGGSLSAGTLAVGFSGPGTLNQTAGSVLVAGSLYLGGGQFSVGNGTTYSTNPTVTGSYTLGGANSSLGAASAFVGDVGTGTLTQNGGTVTLGTLTLSGSAGSQGAYTLAGGTLNVGGILNHDANAYSTGTGTSVLHLAGGALQASASSAAFLGGLTVADVEAGGALVDTQAFNVTVAQNLVHDTSANAPATDGGLTKLGSGTLTLTGVNTFTGPLNLNAGVLVATGEAALGTRGTVTVGGGGTLQFTGDNPTLTRTYNLGFSTLGTTNGQTLTFGGGAMVNGGFLGAGGTLAFADGSALNGTTTAVNSVGTADGTVTFNNATLRGRLTQNSGTLNATNTVVSSAGALTVNAGTFNANGVEVDGVTTINGGGTVNNAAGSLVFGGGSRATVNNGGTLASTATGTSIELNGALLVNNVGGTQSGALNVNYGSVATGGGTFGVVTVGQGGQFGTNTVGSGVSNVAVAFQAIEHTFLLDTKAALMGPVLSAAPGTTNVTSLKLGSGSIFAARVEDATGAPGVGYDLTHAAQTLDLTGSTAPGGQIIIRLGSLNGGGTAGPALNFDPIQNYSFVLVQADGGITGYLPGEFTVDTGGFQNATNGGAFTVDRNGNQLLLDFTAVPEPGTATLLGLGAFGLACCLRRRHRASV